MFGACAALVITPAAFLGPSRADAAGSTKYAVLNDLGVHAGLITKDLFETHQASLAATADADDRTTSCLGDVADAANEVFSDLGELSDLGVLADQMTVTADRLAVLRVLRIKVALDFKIIDGQRELVNRELGGYCSSASPVVAAKAQALLDFMQTAKDQLSDPKFGLAP